MQNALNLEFEVITEVSESKNGLNPVVQTVADGVVDVVADTYVSTYERSKFVEFSYPVMVNLKNNSSM